MSRRSHMVFAALAAAHLLTAPPAFAQSTDGKSVDQPAAATASETTAHNAPRSAAELAEAARAVNGPAGNPECVWLGRRVVALLARDDTDGAFRNLELYDRFGCPGPHIQATFRCVIRQGSAEAGSQQAIDARVHACWLNPSAAAAAAAAAPPATADSAAK